MEIESTLTKKQYMKLNVLMIIRRSSFHFVIAVSSVFIIFGLLSGHIVPYIMAFSYLAIMILLYTISTLYMGLSKKNKNFFLKRQYTFNEENIIAKTPVSEEVLKWEAVINWKKISRYYLLYFSSATFLIIPESDIPASEVTTFNSLLERNIGVVAKSKIGVVAKSKWTWKMKGLLIFIILISIVWLLIIFAGYCVENSIFGGISVVSLVLVMGVPVAALLAEFFLIIYSKRPSSKTKINILYSLLSLTLIGMLIIILDVFVFKYFLF